MFFRRTDKDKLQFQRLDFEILIDDILCSAKPKDADELEWVTRMMVDSLQLAVHDYATDSMKLEDWEDLYF